ncbi:MAG: CDP-glycerol glycerophosphotransferase family protein, partial [Oscillospiraceae bacterium]|nr:CDP-glycerol glycerophosphotransferase family protein [Oscillospiraceae bacterium]
YAFDQNLYMATRDIYEEYEEIVPGKIVNRFDELLDILERREYDDKKLEQLIQKNFTYTDGKSSERAVKLIFGKQTGRREIDAGILRLLAANASEEPGETEEEEMRA